MIRILLFLFLPLIMNAQSMSHDVNGKEWLTDYEKALDVAKNEKKNIMIYFSGSDWCSPCKMLKKDLFQSDEFAKLENNYVLLYIDIPRNSDLLSTTQLQHNKELLSKLNKKGVFPLMKILNPKGKELGEYAGYSMNGIIDYHLDLLKKHMKS